MFFPTPCMKRDFWVWAECWHYCWCHSSTLLPPNPKDCESQRPTGYLHIPLPHRKMRTGTGRAVSHPMRSPPVASGQCVPSTVQLWSPQSLLALVTQLACRNFWSAYNWHRGLTLCRWDPSKNKRDSPPGTSAQETTSSFRKKAALIPKFCWPTFWARQDLKILSNPVLFNAVPGRSRNHLDTQDRNQVVGAQVPDPVPPLSADWSIPTLIWFTHWAFSYWTLVLRKSSGA